VKVVPQKNNDQSLRNVKVVAEKKVSADFDLRRKLKSFPKLLKIQAVL